MITETAIHVVIFAVNVGCDRTTYGDSLCARQHRQEHALWDTDTQYLGQGGAGAAANGLSTPVKAEKIVQISAA